MSDWLCFNYLILHTPPPICRFNRLASGAHKEDEEDLAWPNVKSELAFVHLTLTYWYILGEFLKVCVGRGAYISVPVGHPQSAMTACTELVIVWDLWY